MGQVRKLWPLTIAASILFAACSTQFVPLSDPPTGDQVLTNARRVARDLDSFRATRTTVETTVYPQQPSRNSSVTRQEIFEIGSDDHFSVDQPAFQSGVVRIGDFAFRRYQSSDWDMVTVVPTDDDEFLLPGEVERPPAHPMAWLDMRSVTNARYVRSDTIAGHEVHVVSAEMPMLPGGVNPDGEFPSDKLTFFINVETFQVERIEIDQNILDSLREDSGYQVILGVVEIDTLDIYEYSDHNEDIEIQAPVAPGDA